MRTLIQDQPFVTPAFAGEEIDLNDFPPALSLSDRDELNEWIDNLPRVTDDCLAAQWAEEQVRRDEESATVPPEHTVEYDDAFGIADVVRYMPSDPAEQVKVIDAMMDKLESLRDQITHAENHRRAGEFVDSLQAMIRTA